jgi:hypothetical protein
VDFGQRLGRGRCGIHILQELKQGRAMPGIAFESAAKLVGDEDGLGS